MTAQATQPETSLVMSKACGRMLHNSVFDTFITFQEKRSAKTVANPEHNQARVGSCRVGWYGRLSGRTRSPVVSVAYRSALPHLTTTPSSSITIGFLISSARGHRAAALDEQCLGSPWSSHTATAVTASSDRSAGH
ncbi:hypothetical protein RRG08_020201 [Elysia crispata]|uniref:Uncharacterized protein n=1 Tax=Elysia crispata TaxID=231223 RepID=A0AAE1A3A4_9GAST|nr:hypothetical protein RRG08_020201 [Elysia crispata]